MTEHAGRLTVDAVDVESLAEAMSDGSYDNRWYFHTGTGDVRMSGDWDSGFEDDELADQGWVDIPPVGSRVGFEDMEIFADAVGSLRIRDLLQRSLEGKGAFRRFRDTLREFPDVRAHWHTWVDHREQARAVRWLLDEGHVDDHDADAAMAAHRADAQAALDEVRTMGGLVCDVAAVPANWAEIVGRLDAGEAITLTRDGRPFASIATYDRG